MKIPPSLFAAGLFCCASLSLCAQKTTFDGYYISLNKDTVRGRFIDYPEYTNNPTAISFQPASASQPIVLTPEQCLRVSIGGEDTYVSYTGRRLTNTTDLERETGQKDNYENVTVFLRELFNNGHDQLYELKDRKRTNFYVSADTLPVTELYYKTYIENESIVESQTFRRQLSYMFAGLINEKTGLQGRLERLRYDDKDLVNFFAAVTETKAQKAKNKYPPQLFMAGYSSCFD